LLTNRAMFLVAKVVEVANMIDRHVQKQKTSSRIFRNFIINKIYFSDSLNTNTSLLKIELKN